MTITPFCTAKTRRIKPVIDVRALGDIRRLFPFNRGLYRHGRMQVYVSVGSGTFGPPMRLGTVSEVTLLQLVPAVKERK